MKLIKSSEASRQTNKNLERINKKLKNKNFKECKENIKYSIKRGVFYTDCGDLNQPDLVLLKQYGYSVEIQKFKNGTSNTSG